VKIPFKNECLNDSPVMSPDVRKSSSKITIHDNKTIYIENYKCVISAKDDSIIVKTGHGIVNINGISLKIEYYCPEEIKISGNIVCINFER
jgi:sporulation protein YqfC